MDKQDTPDRITDARAAICLDQVIRYYRTRRNIHLKENILTNTFSGRCPLPTHKKEHGSVTFHIASEPGTGKMVRWRCLSASCFAAQNHANGNDALAFVAAMEECDLEQAAELVLGGLLDGDCVPLD